MARLDFAGAFGAVWDLIRATNSYIEDRQPWALHKAGESIAVAEVLGDCLEALRIVALLASPVIPNAAAELWRRIGMPGRPEHAAPARRRALGPARPGRAAGEGRTAVPAGRTSSS